MVLIGNWVWDFGDGTIAINQNSSHNYTTFSNVTLKVKLSKCVQSITIHFKYVHSHLGNCDYCAQSPAYSIDVLQTH